MGVFANITKASKETEVLNSSQSSKSLNELVDFLNLGGVSQNKLSEATYFTCMKILTESLGRLPLKVMLNDKTEGIVSAREHWAYNLLSVRPNRNMSSTAFWGAVEANRNHYGNAYVFISGVGKSTQLIILPSQRVKIIVDNKSKFQKYGTIWYSYTDDLGSVNLYHPSEIMHFKTSNTMDGLVGISVQEQLAGTINGNADSQHLLNSMYKNGFSAKAVLEYTGDVNDALVAKYLEQIKAFASSDKTGRVVPIPVGSKLTTLDSKLTDSQFLQLRQYGALQIASAFGIKPNQIGDYTKSSYASSEAQQLAFHVDTMLYIIKQYEEEITHKLLSDEDIERGYFVQFNVGVVLRADTKTQIDTMSKAVSSFLYTPNEARAYLGKHNVADGDKLLGNGASIPIDMVGQQYIPQDSRKTETEDRKDERKQQDNE